MKCQRCGKNEASIHYIEIEDEQKSHLWICEDCARTEGISADLDDLDDPDDPDAGSADSAAPGPVTDGLDVFLGGMLDDVDTAAAAERPAQPADCARCGYSYDQLQENGLLGCPDCYEAFRERILPMLRRYHREIGHVGKAPRAEGPRASLRREMAELKTAIEVAIASEAFEEAARLRDAIKQKEQELVAERQQDGPPPQPSPLAAAIAKGESGDDALGDDALGEEAIGEEALGKEAIGEEAMDDDELRDDQEPEA